jgi:hypothetical protein
MHPAIMVTARARHSFTNGFNRRSMFRSAPASGTSIRFSTWAIGHYTRSHCYGERCSRTRMRHTSRFGWEGLVYHIGPKVSWFI